MLSYWVVARLINAQLVSKYVELALVLLLMQVTGLVESIVNLLGGFDRRTPVHKSLIS